MNFPLSIFVLYSLLVTSFAQTGPQIAAYFRQNLSNTSAVYLPFEGNYSFETIQRWNLFSAPTYIVSLKPTSELDVSKIVRLFHSRKSPSAQVHPHVSLTAWRTDRYAYRHNISFLGTGGGHGYSATLGTVRNGIEIDLGHFNTVSIDADASTMTIGGSVRFGNVTGRPLYDAGKEFRKQLTTLHGSSQHY